MSGETESDPSGWTSDQLKVYFERVLVEMDKRYTSQREDDKDARDKALTAMDKRLDGMNEFRGSLQDLSATMMPRTESTARWQSVTEKVDELKARMDATVGEHVGGTEVRRAVLTMAGLVVGAMTLGVAVLVAVFG